MVQIFVITGAVTALFVAALITERRKYIERLISSEAGFQESEIRFRQLAENIREVFYISDPNKKGFLYISPAYETIWKRKRGDFIGNSSSFLETIYPEDRELILASLQKQLRGEETSNEYRILLPDGSINWIWDRAFPIKNKNGQVYQVAGIAEDITLRKEVDEELRRKAEDLSRANQELEHFASIVSHDLKAPVTTVSSFVQLLQRKYRGKLDSDAEEFINYAVDGCKRMNQLIEDLLKNARVGGKPSELQSVNLREQVHAVMDDLKAQIKNAGARITVGFLPSVVYDATQIREVFQNLISNAIKYRREESPVVTITATRLEPQNEWVISVKDNGMGISNSAHKRIFSSFVRLHPQGSYEGSGIGLATCKKVVEQRGGKIWVESFEGQGSIFYFTIPDLCPQGDAEVVKSDQTRSQGDYSELMHSHKRKPPRVFEILMVEDSPADSNIVEILLKKESFPFRIHIVKDGEEAIGFLKRTGGYVSAPIPALILLDLNLPKLDGTAVLREIKADPHLKSIPVIVITSSAREEDIRISYDLSASCYIRKPRDLNGYKEMLVLLRKFWFEQVQLPSYQASPPLDTTPGKSDFIY
jgi:PAS domain S-box-containing protein